jgi:RNA polymerase sigma factor (sigma-70 family)
MTDFELLQRYVRDGAEDAFTTLVRRHVDLVYSAARRQVSLPHLADDITQSVFVELARQATEFRPQQPVAAWLYVVTRRKALDAMRRESRRSAREQAANDPAMTPASDAGWRELAQLLDDGMAQLDEHDRVAVVARFFQNKTFREVGQDLGASEDAAQKRVGRALEQLRQFFLARGVTVTTASLGATLVANAVQPAPAALVATLTASGIGAGTALSGVAAGARGKATWLTKLGLAGAFIASGWLGVAWWHEHNLGRDLAAQIAQADARLETARRERDVAMRQVATSGAAVDGATEAATDPEAALRAEVRAWGGRIERLKKLIARRPELTIPEMQLLGEQAWVDVARNAEFNTDKEVWKALVSLRNKARGEMAGLMMRALEAYLAAHGGEVPHDPLELAPFFPGGIDPATLGRYEIIWQGNIRSAPRENPEEENAASATTRNDRVALGQGAAPVMAECAELLLAGDQRLKVGPSSAVVVDETQVDLEALEKLLKKPMEGAMAAYAKTHQGEMPVDPADLLAYFDPPLEPAMQQRVLAAIARSQQREKQQTPFTELTR